MRYAKYLLETRDDNHLIVAYNQEQAYRLFIEGDGYGLAHIFEGFCAMKHNDQGDHLEIQTPKGIRRVFIKGGGKANSVGAITGMSLGSCIFCEINLLNMDMIQECFRRTFAAQDRYHLADLNPPSPMHPIIKDVFEVQDTKWKHWTIQDNPILTDERKADIKRVLEKSPYLYARDWEGKRVMPDSVIYSMFDMNENVWPTIMGKPYEMFFSTDAGQADATSCSCNIVVRHDDEFKLLRVANYYHSGRDTGQAKAMSVYAREIKEFVKWCTDKFQMNYTTFLVDPACRSIREELHLIGIDTQKADNNGRDVSSSAKGLEVGIERLQNMMSERRFVTVDTEKYDHYELYKNFGLYVRLENGKPIDKWNDNLDECRYSNNYFYKNYVM